MTEQKPTVAHDESPSIIKDHAFDPKGAWFSLCKHCNMAESAHEQTSRNSEIHPIQYYSDDNPDDDEPTPIVWQGDNT